MGFVDTRFDLSCRRAHEDVLAEIGNRDQLMVVFWGGGSCGVSSI